MDGTLPTVAELERAAIAYLERYGGSAERLRRALRRRLERAADGRGVELAGIDAVEEVIAKLTRLGYVDDARWASSRVRVLRRRGKSARAIRASLVGQGVDDAVREALEDRVAELEAARALVRRRRLGPHRPAELRASERARDLARLARAGFSYAVALAALEGDQE